MEMRVALQCRSQAADYKLSALESIRIDVRYGQSLSTVVRTCAVGSMSYLMRVFASFEPPAWTRIALGAAPRQPLANVLQSRFFFGMASLAFGGVAARGLTGDR